MYAILSSIIVLYPKYWLDVHVCITPLHLCQYSLICSINTSFVISQLYHSMCKITIITDICPNWPGLHLGLMSITELFFSVTIAYKSRHAGDAFVYP